MVLSYLSTDSSFSTAVSRAGRTVALSTGGREASLLSAGRMKKLRQQYALISKTSFQTHEHTQLTNINTISCVGMTGRWEMHAHGSTHAHPCTHTHARTHTHTTHTQQTHTPPSLFHPPPPPPPTHTNTTHTPHTQHTNTTLTFHLQVVHGSDCVINVCYCGFSFQCLCQCVLGITE